MAHLAACFEHLDHQSEVDAGYADADAAVTDPASAPFCGCEDCMVREVLHAAWPHLLAEAKQAGPAPA